MVYKDLGKRNLPGVLGGGLKRSLSISHVICYTTILHFPDGSSVQPYVSDLINGNDLGRTHLYISLTKPIVQIIFCKVAQSRASSVSTCGLSEKYLALN